MSGWLRRNWKAVLLVAAESLSITWLSVFAYIWLEGWLTGTWEARIYFNVIGEGPLETALLLSAVALQFAVVWVFEVHTRPKEPGI